MASHCGVVAGSVSGIQKKISVSAARSANGRHPERRSPARLELSEGFELGEMFGQFFRRGRDEGAEFIRVRRAGDGAEASLEEAFGAEAFERVEGDGLAAPGAGGFVGIGVHR